MLLVHGLAGDSEGLGDLGPGPPGAHGLLDDGGLLLVGQAAERHHRGQAVRDVTELIHLPFVHLSKMA